MAGAGPQGQHYIVGLQKHGGTLPVELTHTGDERKIDDVLRPMHTLGLIHWQKTRGPSSHANSSARSARAALRWDATTDRLAK